MKFQENIIKELKKVRSKEKLFAGRVKSYDHLKGLNLLIFS